MKKTRKAMEMQGPTACWGAANRECGWQREAALWRCEALRANRFAWTGGDRQGWGGLPHQTRHVTVPWRLAFRDVNLVDAKDL